MTDEEKLAEEYVKSVIDVNAFDWKIVREISLAYLAGLKTGKEIERVKNNAFTSMKEQGMFPFEKWHKVADGDLPKENKNVLIYFNRANHIGFYRNGFWFTNSDGCLEDDDACVDRWCEIPEYTEEINENK